MKIQAPIQHHDPLAEQFTKNSLIRKPAQPRFKSFSQRKGLSIQTEVTKLITSESQIVTPSWREIERKKFYEGQISPIPSVPSINCEMVSEPTTNGSFLFMGGERVAQNKELLLNVGITHIVNCSGDESTNVFPATFEYKNLAILDTPTEDISRYFSEVISFVEEAASNSGKVLIHCAKGISRSAAVVISYLIFKHRMTFQEALFYIKQCRPICEPNAGFSICLLEWEKLCSDPVFLDNFRAKIAVTTSPSSSIPSSPPSSPSSSTVYLSESHIFPSLSSPSSPTQSDTLDNSENCEYSL